MTQKVLIVAATLFGVIFLAVPSVGAQTCDAPPCPTVAEGGSAKAPGGTAGTPLDGDRIEPRVAVAPPPGVMESDRQGVLRRGTVPGGSWLAALGGLVALLTTLAVLLNRRRLLTSNRPVPTPPPVRPEREPAHTLRWEPVTTDHGALGEVRW